MAHPLHRIPELILHILESLHAESEHSVDHVNSPGLVCKEWWQLASLVRWRVAELGHLLRKLAPVELHDGNIFVPDNWARTVFLELRLS